MSKWRPKRPPPIGRPKRNDEQREKAFRLRLDGLSYSEIGLALGISRQRVQQITSPPVGVWRTVHQHAKGKCVDCGIKPKNGHVHHDRVRFETPESYNDSKNLVFLCVSCHRKRHNNDKERKHA